MDTDRNLLFGVLALQAAFISEQQFTEACKAWTARKAASLAEVLLERGWINADRKQEVDELLQSHLERPGDTPATFTHGTVIYQQSALADADPVVPSTVAFMPPSSEESSLPTLPTLAPGAAVHAPSTLAVVFQPSTAGVRAAIPSSADRRGRYAVSRLHASGGIGRVWVARDEELGRDVALKDLRPEMADNPPVRARFLEEAKITGQLEHPGIVPVYEMVRSAAGHPFYTMRFVRGPTLNDAIHSYHEKRHKGEAGPLELHTLVQAFVAVCQTLAYAHSRGVIHRDLKPLNVILGDYGEVIVLDWGLAKAMGEPQVPAATPEQTSEVFATSAVSPPLPVHLPHEAGRGQTQAGQTMGTPAYMSPEQANGQIEIINALSDVYGLGAILYEILTGGPPFQAGTPLATLFLVLERQPVPPRRRYPAVPRALEAICLRALAKKQEDRYPSATELAKDTQRWLADEPVHAWREPLTARLARWSRRHKMLVASAAVLLLSAVLALTGGLVQQAQARARIEAEKLRAELIKDYLLEGLLAEAAPQKNARHRQVTVEEVLHRAAPKVDRYFREHPDLEVSMRLLIGTTYRRLGAYTQAEAHFRPALLLSERVFGAEDRETLRAVNNVGQILQDQGRPDEAEPFLVRSLEVRSRLWGHEDRDTLDAMNNLAGVLQAQDKLREAEALFRRNLDTRQALWPVDRGTFEAENNLAHVLRLQGRLDEAERFFEHAWDAHSGFLPPGDPSTLAVLNNLGLLRQDQGRLDQAQACLEQALVDRRQNLGADHPETLRTLHNLAVVLQAEGKKVEAERMLRECVDWKRKVLPKESADLAKSLSALGSLLLEKGETKQAEELLQEAVTVYRKAFTRSHWQKAETEGLWGACLTRLGRNAEAEPLLLQSQTSLQNSEGAGLRRVDEGRQRLIQLYEGWGKPDQAVAWRKQGTTK